jgi:hypothetical protein
MFVSLFLLLVWSAAGCRSDAQAQTEPTPTTLAQIQPQIDGQRALTDITIDAASTTEPTGQAERPCPPAAGEPGASHTAALTVDYPAHTIHVMQASTVRNFTSEPLPDLVFSVEANRSAGTFELTDVRLGDAGTAPDFALTGRRLQLLLPQPLLPGCTLTVHLEYVLRPRQIGVESGAADGYFGYTPRQLNLGNVLLFLTARSDGQWVSHDIIQIGEQTLAEPADWNITLVAEPEVPGLIALMPGETAQAGPSTWTAQLHDSRDFSISLSDQFVMSSQQTSDGVTVEMATFPDAVIAGTNGPINGPAHALEAASRALETFSDLFGAYQYDRFTIVEGDFIDGMEFTGLVFVGENWFRTYNGTPASYLFLITVHETAHQWWYGRVGSDQAMMPFLDEALATYSELIFIEEYYPDLRDWWWSTRIATFVPSDFAGAPVDSSVYTFSSARDYINAVYLNGARMLHAVRAALGTEAFFDWLARYASVAAGRIADESLFWSTLSPSELNAVREAVRPYLGSQPVPSG